MAVFHYQALDKSGQKVKGVIDADSAAQARRKLRDGKMAPISVVDARTRKLTAFRSFSLTSRKAISSSRLTSLTRQLATIVQGGIPVYSAIQMLAQDTQTFRAKSLLLSVQEGVLSGQPLSQSMAQFPRNFPDMYRAVIAAGEEAGNLPAVLTHLADYLEDRQHNISKIQLAMIYPLILTLVSVAIVIYLISSVFPDIVDIFIDSDQPLPWLTSAILGMSHFFQDYGILLLIVMVVAAYVLVGFWKQPHIRKRLDERLLSWPLISHFARTADLARFSATLSMMLQSGVSILESLTIASRVVHNHHFKHLLGDVIEDVKEGMSLKVALQNTGYFPLLFVHMIASGESSGKLNEVLDSLARNYEKELEKRTNLFINILEPVIILVMGFVVLLIVLAIVLPIIQLNQLVG